MLTNRNRARIDAALVAEFWRGHTEGVRAFAEWYRKHWSEYNWEDGPPPAAEAYLASLAAKPVTDAKEEG